MKLTIITLMLCMSPIHAFESVYESIENNLAMPQLKFNSFNREYVKLFAKYPNQHAQIMKATIFIYNEYGKPLSNKEILNMYSLTLAHCNKKDSLNIAMVTASYLPKESAEIGRIYYKIVGKKLELNVPVRHDIKDAKSCITGVCEKSSPNPLNILMRLPIITPVVTPPSSTSEYK